MKKIFFGLSMFAMIVFMAIPAYALPYTDYVDIGNINPDDPDSEVGHILGGWGPIYSGTAYGGGSEDGTLRVISSGKDMDGNTVPDDERTNWASINLEFDGIGLSALHLEGQAKDSFYVYIDVTDWDDFIYTENGYGSAGDGVVPVPEGWTHYFKGEKDKSEDWLSTTFDLSDTPLYGLHTITFLSDQPHADWSGWDTWGQVAFSSIAVEPIPEPSTMLLLGAGLLGLAGFGRKKFFKK